MRKPNKRHIYRRRGIIIERATSGENHRPYRAAIAKAKTAKTIGIAIANHKRIIGGNLIIDLKNIIRAAR